MTLYDFIFVLNQDEDILIKVIDFDTDEVLIDRSWKSDLKGHTDFLEIKKRNVCDFIVCKCNSNTMLEIVIY